MSEPEQTTKPQAAPARAAPVASYSARRRSGLIVVVAAGLVLATLGGLSALLLRGSVDLPEPVVEMIEDRLREAADTRGITRIGGIELALADSGRPRIVLHDMVYRSRNGRDSLRVPRAEITLARRALARAELRPEELVIDGAALRFSRRGDGFVQLALQSGETLSEGPSLPALIARIDEIFDVAPFDHLRALRLSDLTLELSDSRLARGLTLSGGEARVDVSDRRIALSLALDLEDAPDGAGASLRFETDRRSPDTRMSLRLRDLPAPLLSRQSPAFAALEAFEGTVSARLDGALAPDGALAGLLGQVELGAGPLEVPWQDTPLQLEAAALGLGYDPALKRFVFSGLELRSDLASGRFDGTIDVLPLETGESWPDIQFALAGEVSHARLTPKLRSDLSDMEVQLSGRFSGPARSLDLGLVHVHDLASDARATGAGRVQWSAGAPPRLALDLHAPRLPAERVIAFWPAQGKGHKLGGWLARNVLDGTLRDTQVALRLTRGARPELGLSFAYEDARVQVLPDFPPLVSQRGHATLFDHRFLIGVAEGAFTPEGDTPVALDGSSFEVADTRIKGTDAKLRLQVAGPAQAVLDVLAREPVRLRERVSLPPQGLSGALTGEAELLVPLRRGAVFDLDALRVDATLNDSAIERIAQDHDLRDASIDIRIAGPELSLSGSGALAEMPLSFALSTALDRPRGAAPTVIEGTARVTPPGLAALGARLPEGAVTGAGAQAAYSLTLQGAASPPQLSVSSDLDGLAVDLPALGWRKPAAERAALSAEIVLGDAPELRAFELDGNGVAARGSLRIDPVDRSLEWVELEQLALGEWLDVQAQIVGRGADATPTIALTGGEVDLRRRPAPRAEAAPEGVTASPFALQLDRVTLSDAIFLTGVRGSLQMGSVVTGEVSGLLNGREPVRVALAASETGRQSLRLTAENGGAALAAAGILSNLRGGPMVLTLQETAQPGTYDGRLVLRDTQLVENPAAVEILSALSIVGLLEQMANGGGIGLTEVSTDLTLAPGGVALRNGLANGPSIGLTFEGVVVPAQDRLDLQGVVSPLYVINAIGGELLGKPGEGLIGVNYRIGGSPDRPSVSVNPLSVLTPGIFRDLFRRPAPQLTQ